MNRNGRATGNAGNLMGILLIVAGVVIAGNVMNWWNISLFFRGWWTLLSFHARAMSGVMGCAPAGVRG